MHIENTMPRFSIEDIDVYIFFVYTTSQCHTVLFRKTMWNNLKGRLLQPHFTVIINLGCSSRIFNINQLIFSNGRPQIRSHGIMLPCSLIFCMLIQTMNYIYYNVSHIRLVDRTLLGHKHKHFRVYICPLDSRWRNACYYNIYLIIFI